MAELKPTIVLLPGLDGTCILFEKFAAMLGQYFEVLPLAYPPDTVLDYSQLVDYVGARLPDKPFILLAESFAGPLAMHLTAAGQYPVRGLILCVTFARYPLWWLSPAASVVDHLPIYWLRDTQLSRHIMQKELGDALLADVDRAVAAVKPEVMLARMRFVLKMDASAALQQVRVPMLYLRATDDMVVRASAWQHIKQQRPDVKLLEFPTHHFLLQSMPQECVAAIAEFAKSLEL